MRNILMMAMACSIAVVTFAAQGFCENISMRDEVSKLLLSGECSRSFTTNELGASLRWASDLRNALTNRYMWAEERSEDFSKFRQGYFRWVVDLSPNFRKGELASEGGCVIMSGEEQRITCYRNPRIEVYAHHNLGQYYCGWIGESAYGHVNNVTVDGISVDWAHTTSNKICWVTNAENSVSTHIAEIGMPVEYMILDLSRGVVRFVDKFVASGEDRMTRIVLKRVKPGTYIMGSPKGEYGRYEGDDPRYKEDQCEVTITNSFYIGIFEITRGQWHTLCGEVPRADPCLLKHDNWQKVGQDWEMRPVLADAWQVGFYFIRNEYDKGIAGSFIAKLQEKFPCLDIALPNEKEWEYVCRAGTCGAYGVVDGKTGTRIGCFTGKNYGKPQGIPIVGSFMPNAWGVYDMNGSLPEWCSDCDDFGYQVVRGKDRSAGRSVINKGLEGGDMYAGFRIKIRDCFRPEKINATTNP